MAKPLPKHLQKYVVEQNYDQYTPVDHAVWRYILRQLRNFLGQHAHECYLDGLQKTGIEIEKIPRISEISAKLEKFGWQAIPVSGFIPPAAFMELQSLGFLPIASAMRSLDHLLYTPAPDIVHEAAGHAPILIHPEFASYLQEYAQIAKKAIISKEDLDMYEAIRELSDIKEHPESTKEQISAAQKKLEAVSKKISHISEAAELGRMNWWTAEYGLIGDINNPKIFGAGLLSSVGESKHCLDPKVRKIPLSMKCIETGYDITEPQPQLFVTPDFKTLKTVLQDMANQMAFRVGGLKSIQKIIQAQSVNSVELDSGVQISGVCTEVITVPHQSEIAYLKFEGPTQLCFRDKEIPGHGKSHHQHGFGMAFGELKDSDWRSVITKKGSHLNLEFKSGIKLSGTVKVHTKIDGHLLIVSFDNCKVSLDDKVLFDPSWGIYDLAIGSKVTSVFGGPADRDSYGEMHDFAALRVPPRKLTEDEIELFSNYSKVRTLREKKVSGVQLESELSGLLEVHQKKFKEDWLLLLESYELLANRAPSSSALLKIKFALETYANRFPLKKSIIEDGLKLANHL